jgi:hypothetical protein
MHNERCTSGSEGERQKPTAATPHGADARPLLHDSLMSGRRFRAFAVLDEWSRESPAIEVDLSLTGERVTRVLERLRAVRGLPSVIQADNGPELRGRVLDQWTYENGVRLQLIEPGKPIQNAHIESFNPRLREECLNEHVFVSLEDARNQIEKWRIEYNRERPHSSLGNLTPEEFAAKHQMSSAVARAAWPAAEPELAGAAQRAPASDQNLTVFRPPSDHEGRPEELGMKRCIKATADTNLRMGYQTG